MEMKKIPPLVGGDTQNIQGNHNNKKLGKLSRMLSVFASGISLNTFEAKEIADTCLHTTISDLQARHHITFSRRGEKVTNRYGTQTRVLRYWLEGENLERAQAIIDGRVLP